MFVVAGVAVVMVTVGCPASRLPRGPIREEEGGRRGRTVGINTAINSASFGLHPLIILPLSHVKLVLNAVELFPWVCTRSLHLSGEVVFLWKTHPRRERGV